MDEDTAFKAAVEEIRESAIDHVESKLFSLIDSGDTGSTIFFLKTRAKKRGYVERSEITGADGGPVEMAAIAINIVQPKESNE